MCYFFIYIIGNVCLLFWMKMCKFAKKKNKYGLYKE